MSASDTRRRDRYQRQSKRLEKHPHRRKKKEGRKGRGSRLVKVWEDTEEYCAKHCRKAKGYKIEFSELEPLESPCFCEDGKCHECPKDPSSRVDVRVLDIDTLDAAIILLNEGHKEVLVLNMASEFKPGGGVRNGRTAQEEELFRRTNAFISHSPSFYPLDPRELIYSHSITIIKDSEYEYLEEERTVGMVTCPAVRHPALRDGKYQKEEDRELVEEKIEAIFRLAAAEKYPALVLGAMGCGVFCNPPEVVAEIFAQMIEKYGHCFKVIIFAVLSVGQRGKKNYRVFCDRLEDH